MKSLIVKNVFNYYDYKQIRGKTNFSLLKKIPKNWLLNFQEKVKKIDCAEKDLIDYAILFNDDYLIDFCIENNIDFNKYTDKHYGLSRRVRKVICDEELKNIDDFINLINKIENKINSKINLNVGYNILNERIYTHFETIGTDEIKMRFSKLVLFLLERISNEQPAYEPDLLIKSILSGIDELKIFIKENLSEKSISNILNNVMNFTSSPVLLNYEDKKESVVKFLLSCNKFNKNVVLNENCVTIDLTGIFYSSLNSSMWNEKNYNQNLVRMVDEHLKILEEKKYFYDCMPQTGEKKKIKI